MTSSLVRTASDPAAIRRTLGMGQDVARTARRRMETLAQVKHRGFAIPTGVAEQADGAVVATTPRVDGLDLAATVRASGPLSAGECVWLGMAILDALAELHTHGLAHGDISPANVVMSRNGPVLVDLLSGPLERGTPGFAAPERAARADAAADVYSVGRVLSAVVDERSRLRIDAWVAPMIAAESAARPDAATAARALASCDEPVAVAPRVLDVAADLRARASAPLADATMKDPAAWPWRVRSGVLRGMRWAGLVALGVCGLWLSLGAWNAATPPAQPHYDPGLPIASDSVAAAPDAAATELIVARAYAQTTGAPSALRDTTLTGSPARKDDSDLLRGLTNGKIRVDGLAVALTDGDVLSQTGHTATVAATYETSAHTVWIGKEAERIEATVEQIEIDLRWTNDGWKIERLRTTA